jgi:mono/diheme cytochrome c family protein
VTEARGEGKKITTAARRRFSAALTVALLAGAWGGFALASGRSGQTNAVPPGLKGGKQLYRQYCGQCHALTAALAVGFGTENGLGQNGGPSFDRLRVPFNLSVVAVTTPFAGHEVVFTKMTWSEVKQVANYVAVVTKKHPALAQPIDD